MRTSVAMVLLVLLCSCSNDEQADEVAPLVTSEQAQVIAERAFLSATEGKVTKYSVRSFGDTSAHWGFVVEGTGEFARPGHAWIVTINRADGRAEVTAGM